MLKLIKMYMKKMLLSRSTYVLLIIAAAFSCIFVFSMHEDQEYYRENPQAYQEDMEYMQELEEDDDSVTVGYVVGTTGIEESTYAEFVDGMFPSMLPCLLIAIFVVIFVCSEHSSGYVKNVSGSVSNRGMLFLAKIPTIIVFSLLVIGVTLLLLLILFKPMMGYFHLGNGTELAKIIALDVGMYTVLAIVLGALCSIIRSTAISMTLGVMMTSGLIGVIYMLITSLLRYIFDIGQDFNLSNYTVSGSIPQLVMGISDCVVERTIIVGCAFLVVSIIAGYFMNKKRDV